MTDIHACEVLIELKYYAEDLPHFKSDEVRQALTHAIKCLLEKE